MYLEQFGLRERPFSHAPDERFVYRGERHERALAHLRLGVQAPGGVSYLVGASGTGKTTLCRRLLKELPERVDVALILDPVPTPQELCSVVSDQLGVAHGTDTPSLILGDSLLRRQAAGRGARRTAVIVDEAQTLSLDVLEQLYLLSTLEVDGQKLLAIILVGEPWLTDLLLRTAPRQRATAAVHHLLPFTESETRAYVGHRMAVAGGRLEVFDDGALRIVHRLSSGVPRVINTLCAQALMSAVARRRVRVDRSIVRAAARTALAPTGSPPSERIAEAPRAEPLAAPPKPARAPAQRARRSPWPWLVTGGLVINAAVIATVLLAPRPPDVARISTEARAEADVEKPAAKTPATMPQPPQSLVSLINERPAMPQSPPGTMPETPPPLSVIEEPVRTGRPPGTSAPGLSGPADETPRQRHRRERAELAAVPAQPPAANQVLPPREMALKVDMLVWAAEPRQRMVYVNGHKYVEGQTLENGAVLERIEQDGIVLTQGGQRVKLRSEVR